MGKTETAKIKKEIDFTNGPILGPLMKFMLPILAALAIQSLYGAVDLLIVGQFGSAANVSSVSIGSQLIWIFTSVAADIAMGTTVLIGQFIGEGKRKNTGDVIGTSIILFSGIAIVVMAIILILAPQLMTLMQAPLEAFEQGVAYTRICGAGMVFIIAYNVVGAVFRGVGDSKTPLIAVAIASVINLGGDLLLVGVFHMGAAGAAIATIFSQGISVVISILLVRKKGLPFTFSKENLKFDKKLAISVVKIGLPLALMDGIVSGSFAVMGAICNSLGLAESAGAGVGGKLITFIMLVPLASMQSLAAFNAHNIGAKKLKRAKKAFIHAVWISLVFSCIMFYFSFLHGTWLTRIFTTDPAVTQAAALYLKAYSIDTFLTSFLFCFIGYFNGCGKTTITMIQGLLGVVVRIPIALLFLNLPNTNLFIIGLATPISTVCQIALCAIYYFATNKKVMKLFDSEYNPELINNESAEPSIEQSANN